MERYGKTNQGYLEQKAFFLDPAFNKQRVAEVAEIVKVYCSQPKRRNCVLCDDELAAPLFHHFGAGYGVCQRCGHLNGEFQDTPAFAGYLYGAQAASGLSVTYSDADKDAYMKRVTDIYAPKVEFMCAALEEDGYITHPYTSAGRVPSDLGYRFYVEALMAEEPLSSSEQRTTGSTPNS